MNSQEKTFSTHGLPLLLLAVTVLFWLGFMSIVIYQSALTDDASDMMIVVFPPSQPTHDIYSGVIRAHGQVVEDTWFDNIWLVHSDANGFVSRLKAEGAWAAFSPVALHKITLGGCFSGIFIPTE